MIVTVNDKDSMSSLNYKQYYDTDISDAAASTRAGIIAAVRLLIGYTGAVVTYKYTPSTGVPDTIVLTCKLRNEVVRIVVFRPLAGA
jgi:hypothetical protein